MLILVAPRVIGAARYRGPFATLHETLRSEHATQSLQSLLELHVQGLDSARQEVSGTLLGGR